MIYVAGESAYVSFGVSDSTGAARAADSTPTATLFRNGASTGTVVTVTSAATGAYVASFTVPAYTAGDELELLIAATVDGLTYRNWKGRGKVDILTASVGSAVPSAAAIADAVWDEGLGGHTTAGSTGLALSTAATTASGAIKISSADPALTDTDAVNGEVKLFVGDLHSRVLRALIGGDPPGGVGATWTVSTTVESTGAPLTTDYTPTILDESLGYFSYPLQTADTAIARRVRLTLKRTLSGDVRIFGPLVLNVRDR